MQRGSACRFAHAAGSSSRTGGNGLAQCAGSARNAPRTRWPAPPPADGRAQAPARLAALPTAGTEVGSKTGTIEPTKGDAEPMTAARTSTLITTISALVLAAGGVALLFASDELLPRAIAGMPAGAAVLGQLVAAGWLALAWLNWNQRHTIVGGIYGRLTVLPTLALYMVSAFSLAHPVLAGGAPVALVALAVLFGVLALVYAALLLQGPFGADA